MTRKAPQPKYTILALPENSLDTNRVTGGETFSNMLFAARTYRNAHPTERVQVVETGWSSHPLWDSQYDT